MRSFWRKRNRYKYAQVDPDEIFLDAYNSPKFDQQQFEGRIEKPIPKGALVAVSIFFVLVSVVFLGKLSALQVVHGSEYYQKSERNSLNRKPIFADRGVIFDRNGMPLAWNSENVEDEFPLRMYTDLPGLAHVIGYVGYPQRDNKGFYWQDYFAGKAGIEKYYNSTLRGVNGSKILERDAQGNVQTENMVDMVVDGENVALTVDAELQSALYQSIAGLAERAGYDGGAGVIMDIHNGDILALTSYPEYDPMVVSSGSNVEQIREYFSSENTPILNRATVGLYTPGSTIKPFLALGVLKEELIDPDTKLESTGSISVPNPYNPDAPTIFRDWKVHGWVDMRDALAVSSNTYFFEVGGGFEDQKGLGIDRIDRYVRMFGIASPTGLDFFPERVGVIPNREWKTEHFEDGTWRVGDTYNTAIGQYGFQVTPLQMVRATAAIANGGTLVTPRLLQETPPEQVLLPTSFDPEDIQVVWEGMRQAVTDGTAAYLNIRDVAVAAKTGTAELGTRKEEVHSWVIGFFPYENPQYAFSVLMERGPATDTVSATRAVRPVLEWIAKEAPEYLK